MRFLLLSKLAAVLCHYISKDILSVMISNRIASGTAISCPVAITIEKILSFSASQKFGLEEASNSQIDFNKSPCQLSRLSMGWQMLPFPYAQGLDSGLKRG